MFNKGEYRVAFATQYGMTSCICNQFAPYRAGEHTFETQCGSYNCGPIAIINALHFERRPAGPAIHRQIAVGCRPKARHADGFKGTKPEDMDHVIRWFWPKATRHTGAAACLVALTKGPAILLFQRSPRLQHYIFVHYDGTQFHLENEADNETVLEKEMSAYMNKTPVVWLIKS